MFESLQLYYFFLEDFNKKIMNAGLTKAELVALHAEAKYVVNVKFLSLLYLLSFMIKKYF